MQQLPFHICERCDRTYRLADEGATPRLCVLCAFDEARYPPIRGLELLVAIFVFALISAALWAFAANLVRAALP